MIGVGKCSMKGALGMTREEMCVRGGGGVRGK